MGYAARFDEFGRPAWIALTVLGFIVFWPIGLALLIFSIWSRKMGYWHNHDEWHQRAERLRDNMCGGWQSRAERREERHARRWARHMSRHSSGNRAFDEYREETLRRLEEEQTDFHAFLDRLRMAKDKAEFDEFLNERRRRAAQGPDVHPPGTTEA
jgi:hypothetical protein